MNIRSKIYGGGKATGEPLLGVKKRKGAKPDALLSIAVEREAKRLSNDRIEDRHRLSDERATATHNGADHEVELINLSGGGAMVSGSFEPMLWDRVDLHLGQHGTIECAVRWLRGDRIGLEFAHETHLDCSATELAALLRNVIARSFPDVALVESDEPAPSSPDPFAGDDHRAAPRHPLIWNGVLHHDYESTPVRIRNISKTGAMIETSVPVRVGAQPLLEIGDSASLAATVEWVIGDEVGLHFHSPFDVKLLADARPSVAGTSWSRPDYLESAPGGAGDSPWDPHWKRLSLTELQQQLDGFLKH